MNFEGMVVVVTGSSSGIGKSSAEILLKNGAIVCGFDMNSSSIEHDHYRHFRISIVDEDSPPLPAGRMISLQS